MTLTACRAPSMGLLVAALSVWAGLGAQNCQAQWAPLTFGLAESITSQDNLTRASPGNEQYDLTQTTALNAGYVQTFGRQQVQASASVNWNRNRDNPQLNNRESRLVLSSAWSTLERISGTVAYDMSRQLYRYGVDSDVSTNQLNLATTRHAGLHLRKGSVTPLTLELGFDLSDRSYSLASFASQASRQSTASFSGSWAFSPDWSVNAALQLNHSESPHAPLLGSLDSRSSSLGSQWSWSKSSLGLRLGRSQTSQADVASTVVTTWGINASWAPSASLRVGLAASKDGSLSLPAGAAAEDTRQFFSQSASVTTSRSATLGWNALHNLSLNAQVGSNWREYQVIRSSTGLVLGDGRSRYDQFSLGVSYQFQRYISASCSYSLEHGAPPTGPLPNGHRFDARTKTCSLRGDLR